MGTLRGVPVVIGPSWPVVALVIVLLFGPRLEVQLPDLGIRAYAVAAAYALLLLISVLVHEAAHALVGQQQGYHVQRIVADLWGGHTAYDQGDSTPRASALVAVVGPLANGALAAGGWLLLQVMPAGGVPELLVVAFAWSNGFVALFNLLPGLPLDGGFLVEALVWQLTGRRTSGTVVAGWCGRGAAALVLAWALLLPLLLGLSPSLVTVAGAVFLASFMWFGATTAIRSGQGRAVIARVRVRDVLEPVTVIEDATPVDHLPSGAVVVHRQGRGPWGLVDPDAVAAVPATARATATADAVAAAQPAGWAVRVESADDDVLPLVAAVQESGTAVLLVLFERPDPGVGLVRTQDLSDALARAERRRPRRGPGRRRP